MLSKAPSKIEIKLEDLMEMEVFKRAARQSVESKVSATQSPSRDMIAETSVIISSSEGEGDQMQI